MPDSHSTMPDVHESWRIFRIMSEFVEGFEVMAPVGKAVSIFGSARTRPEDPHYIAAEQTARLLVKQDFAVITGGGPGIMEAANKGAFEAGGTSVGCNITLPQEQEANKYQNISLDFHYFYARKVMFTKYASAFIAFPGGYGTLDETFENLTLIQTLKIDPFPVILYDSSYWGGLIDWLTRTLKGRYTDDEDLDIFRVADSPEQAVKLAVEGVKHHWWKPLDADLQDLVGNDKAKKKKPVEGAAAGSTGEGTRYGRRAHPTTKKHADAPRRPTQ